MKKTALLIVLSLFIFCFCSKEDEPEPVQKLVYHSLVAEKDTIVPGEEISITATATGSNLQYFWSASLGDILGSGATVIYATSPCQIGKNKITCKITNGNDQSESKTITIVVQEESF